MTAQAVRAPRPASPSAAATPNSPAPLSAFFTWAPTSARASSISWLSRFGGVARERHQQLADRTLAQTGAAHRGTPPSDGSDAFIRRPATMPTTAAAAMTAAGWRRPKSRTSAMIVSVSESCR